MKGSVYLIGGGEIKKGDMLEIDDELKEVASANATFAFFCTAAGDSSEYISSIESVFKSNYRVIAPTEKDGSAFALSAINTASIIYFGGGTTELLLDLFEKWKLVQHLRNALDRGTHLVGISAGAQALAAWYVHENGDTMELRRGWGLVPVCILVHAHQNSSVRAKMLWEDSRDAHANLFVAIGEGAAWRINPFRAQKIGSGEAWSVQKP